MTEPAYGDKQAAGATRRLFLSRVGAAVGAVTSGAGVQPLAAADAPAANQVAHRVLGKTGLKISEIGFGGHSWAYAKVPDGRGGLRKVNLDEAMRMISIGLDAGVNFFDACTPPEEHSVPGEVIHRLKKRNQVVISARLCHKMKGVPADRAIIGKWVDERLRLWRTDRFDILMLTNESRVTPRSGYWEMSYCLEAVEQLKRQGKIRFAGFGCHFAPEGFRDAFARYGRAWDVVSMPYNIRHRAAEPLLVEAEKVGLGIVTIKAMARGELLVKRDPAGADAGLARDMIAFVLENPQVDCCICGVHSEEQLKENLSASWTRLTPEGRKRLETVAAAPGMPRIPGRHVAWLENGWIGEGRGI